MTLRLDASTRAREAALKRELAEIKRPMKEAQRAERKAAAKARPKREKRVKHENAKPNRGRVVDNGYLAFLRRQACCVGPLMNDRCEGRTDPAHIRFSDPSVGRFNPGLSRKSDDRWCLPVCRKHHEAQHAHGNERAWWSSVVKADPNALAEQFFAAYRAEGRAA